MSIGDMIALGSLLLLIITGIGNWGRAGKNEATGQARYEAKLDSIATGVDDIRVEQRAMRDRVDVLAERMAGVEQSTKSAHHRLDEMEARFLAAHPPDKT